MAGVGGGFRAAMAAAMVVFEEMEEEDQISKKVSMLETFAFSKPN